MKAIIYLPTKSATQSGSAQAKEWVLAYEHGAKRSIDPVTGWIGSADTRSQKPLKFRTCEEAVSFAEREKLDFTVLPAPIPHAIKPRLYADNFAYNRKGTWTH